MNYDDQSIKEIVMTLFQVSHSSGSVTMFVIHIHVLFDDYPFVFCLCL